MPGSKVRNHVVLAHKWLYDFTPRYEDNSGAYAPRYPNSGRIAGVHRTEQSWHQYVSGNIVNHACMNEHIFENLYGEQPCH